MENRHFWLWQKYFLVQEGAMKDKNKMATAVTLLTALRMFTNGKQIFNFPWFNKMSCLKEPVEGFNNTYRENLRWLCLLESTQVHESKN